MGIGRPDVPHISILGPILPPMTRGCWKRGTMVIGRREILHISIMDHIVSPMTRGGLRPRTGEYGICTDYGNTFLNSPFP